MEIINAIIIIIPVIHLFFDSYLYCENYSTKQQKMSLQKNTGVHTMVRYHYVIINIRSVKEITC